MTDNPLKSGGPTGPKRTAQEWCDIGNSQLAGLTPYKNGEFRVRRDIHWFVVNGQPTIGFKP